MSDTEKKQKEEYVHNYKVRFEDSDRLLRGIYYLKTDLQYEEARVFFHSAYDYGKAEFEDDEDRQFTLRFTGGIYILENRN